MIPNVTAVAPVSIKTRGFIQPKGRNPLMPSLATWIRPKDEKWFRPIFERFPAVRICNALQAEEPMDRMSGLLLTGGPDISKEFLRQDVPDESVLEKDVDPKRDAWEFAAVKAALAGGLPIFAICKGLQVFNVALGGTLKLDIQGHNLPEMRDHDVQPLRTERSAAHRLEKSEQLASPGD